MSLIGAIAVSLYYFDKIKLKNKNPTILKVYWFLWNESIAFAFVLTISYWLVIYEGQEVDLENVLIHVINSIVLGLDLIIVKHPPRYLNGIFIVMAGVLYGLFTWIFQFIGGKNK